MHSSFFVHHQIHFFEIVNTTNPAA